MLQRPGHSEANTPAHTLGVTLQKALSGTPLQANVGLAVGVAVGDVVGAQVGFAEGADVGDAVGAVGAAVGDVVGSLVQCTLQWPGHAGANTVLHTSGVL